MIAANNFGIITSAEARSIGITNNELVQFAKRGKIERISYGVYRLSKHIPSQNDPYAVAVALVDPEAYLYGEAVLGTLELTPTAKNTDAFGFEIGEDNMQLPDELEDVSVSKSDPNTVVFE